MADDRLQGLAEQLLKHAKQAGADAADALAVSGSSVMIDVRAGALEQAERAEGIDIGLRVLLGRRQAMVSSSDIRSETLEQMALRAVAMAREAPEDPYQGLADPEQLARDWDLDALELCDPAEEPSPSALEDDAREAEAAAMETGLISQVQSASAAYGKTDVFLAATNGFFGGYSRTDRTRSCVAIAGTGTGMERDYDGDGRIWQSDLRGAAEIGKTAAERAAARIGARKPKTGTYPVLFDERIAASLIGHLLSAINGNAIARRSSWLLDALGEQVLPDGVSIIENPHRPRCSASRPFDGEGLPTHRREIVSDGILTGWTLDLGTARKLGMASTGNAVRGTSSSPSPSNWNIELTQGNRSRAELLRDMGTGILVTSMIGSTISPTTGDYSRGATGFWVENGEPVYPVNECTIAGNLRDMLLRMIPANDARPYLSRVVPSILIEGMTLAGA